MAKALIVYASLTGNTEEIAHVLSDAFQKLKVDTRVIECTQVNADAFLMFDICVVATYTYGREGELPDEISDFYEELGKINLTGKVYGTLGSGEIAYGYYCKSADDFDQQFKLTNATRGADVVKVELNPEVEDIENIKVFAKRLLLVYDELKNK